MNSRSWRHTIVGALFICAGMLLLGSQAGWWQIDSIFDLWPLALVGVGLQRGFPHRGGLLWVGWGVLLLLWSMHVLELSHTWPLIVVLYGIAMVMCQTGSCRVRRDGSRVG
jgi:hypothetical protein